MMPCGRTANGLPRSRIGWSACHLNQISCGLNYAIPRYGHDFAIATGGVIFMTFKPAPHLQSLKRPYVQSLQCSLPASSPILSSTISVLRSFTAETKLRSPVVNGTMWTCSEDATTYWMPVAEEVSSSNFCDSMES